MKKVIIVAVFLTIIHLIEDLLWVFVGRYTDVSLWIVIAAIICMGIGGGLLVEHSKVKKFLGK